MLYCYFTIYYCSVGTNQVQRDSQGESLMAVIKLEVRHKRTRVCHSALTELLITHPSVSKC